MSACPPTPPFLEASPAPFLARGLAWLLLAILVIGVFALVLVRIPETVVAPFVLVPEHGAVSIRTLHDGLVTGVRVADAQAVEMGDTLFTIESELVGDRTAERTALGASIVGGETRLVNERQRFDSQRHADELEQTRLEGRLMTLAGRRALLERQVETAREVASRQQRSHEEGLTSWLEASKPRLEADRLAAELEAARGEERETRTAIARFGFEMEARRATFREITRGVEEELARVRTRKGMLDAEVSREGHAWVVTAPCPGTLVRLVVTHAGAVVRSSDLLAEIACRDERLQAELLVPQRGLALVRPGQRAALRYDAFPYQRFGARYATLRWVSPATASTTSGAFRVLADIDERTLQINGGPIAVLPGMVGRASIVVGRRTLASYAIEPLRAVREAVSSGRPGDSS